MEPELRIKKDTKQLTDGEKANTQPGRKGP